MTNYEIKVSDLSTERETTENKIDGSPDVGDILGVEVTASRSKPDEIYKARYTVTYGVSDGIAKVRSVNPDSHRNTDPEVKTASLAHILMKTDRMVRESVPDVEAVKSLNQSLRNERAKYEQDHPHANTDKFDGTSAQIR